MEQIFLNRGEIITGLKHTALESININVITRYLDGLPLNLNIEFLVNVLISKYSHEARMNNNSWKYFHMIVKYITYPVYLTRAVIGWPQPPMSHLHLSTSQNTLATYVIAK